MAAMKDFWREAEQCWNRNRVIAWVLVLLAIGFVLCAVKWPQSPGVSIGLLAAAAGVMSLRPRMHIVEKFMWVAVLVAFAVLEVQAIGRSDKAAEATRDAQNRAFQSIVDGMKKSVDTSKSQYDSTIQHVDGVLETTKKVANLAEQNLGNITGGDSYAFVYPENYVEISNTPAHCRFALKIHNDGKQILTGVSVKVLHVVEGTFEPGIAGIVKMVPDPANPLEVGNLAPHMGESIPRYSLIPVLHPDETAAYHIWITSQNGGFSEDLYFRRSKDNKCLAYRLRVTGFANGKRRAGDVHQGNDWYRTLKTIDWTEPTYVASNLP